WELAECAGSVPVGARLRKRRPVSRRETRHCADARPVGKSQRAGVRAGRCRAVRGAGRRVSAQARGRQGAGRRVSAQWPCRRGAGRREGAQARGRQGAGRRVSAQWPCRQGAGRSEGAQARGRRGAGRREGAQARGRQGAGRREGGAGAVPAFPIPPLPPPAIPPRRRRRRRRHKQAAVIKAKRQPGRAKAGKERLTPFSRLISAFLEPLLARPRSSRAAFSFPQGRFRSECLGCFRWALGVLTSAFGHLRRRSGVSGGRRGSPLPAHLKGQSTRQLAPNV
ncbi:hypothetical protein chiPu_0022338, partial [Chiloscyllium punctatum]|nr:hypothetical protein [Chiloscyllium punctatum]